MKPGQAEGLEELALHLHLLLFRWSFQRDLLENGTQAAFKIAAQTVGANSRPLGESVRDLERNRWAVTSSPWLLFENLMENAGNQGLRAHSFLHV